MVWYVISAIAAFIAMVVLVLTFVRDRRYEKKRVLDAMGPGLREEIEQEREEALKRREKFQAALGTAMGGKDDEETERSEDIS
jgi:hypothetical protein